MKMEAIVRKNKYGLKYMGGWVSNPPIPVVLYICGCGVKFGNSYPQYSHYCLGKRKSAVPIWSCAPSPYVMGQSEFSMPQHESR